MLAVVVWLAPLVCCIPGCRMFGLEWKVATATTTTAGAGATVNEASLFWVLGLVVACFVALAIVVCVLVWKITRRVLMTWTRVANGGGKRVNDGGTGQGDARGASSE